MLILRQESRAEAERHLLKLQSWMRGSSLAIDLTVLAIPRTDIFEACLTDAFGLGVGLLFTFWEDVLCEPVGHVWIISFRRDDELLSVAMMQILHQRKEIIPESGEQFQSFIYY